MCREKKREEGRREEEKRSRVNVSGKKGKGKTGSPRLAGTFPPYSPTLNSTVCVFMCVCVRVLWLLGDQIS